LSSFAVPKYPPNDKPKNTQYINMFLQLNYISQLYNIYTFISTYILLVGYIILPNIFTSIRNSSVIKGVISKSYTR
jgi:hypothetical protein